MEFKGTKGKWSVVETINHPTNEGEQVSFIQTKNVCMDIMAVENEKFNRDELKANAQLISKAPEMLEMLKKHRDYLDSIRHEWEEGERYLYYMTNGLIKEATTI